MGPWGVLAGLALCLLAWAGLRRSVGATWRRTPVLALALDGLPVLAGYSALLAATARPLLSALPILAAAAGLALADRVKRAVLREPLVFADRAELLEIVRHPRLYLPFAGTGTVVAGAVAAALGLVALAWLEPALWTVHPLPGLLAACAAALAFWALLAIPSRPPLLHRLARAYADIPVTRDPARDAAALGMLACFIVHATLARAERPVRQAAARDQARGRPPLQAAGPIVLVQAESFFDARRLHPDLDYLLPNWVALTQAAVRHGRLQVPCWGANTVRTEFAVLTGLPESALGLDRFNPYEAFARVRLPSIAEQARQAGYRTVCVHPFDLGFYGRDRVLPLLGFDELVGPEAFTTSKRAGAYVADVEVAAAVARVVTKHGPRVLVLAITMENHGPWDGASDPLPPIPLPPAMAGCPEARELGRWLRHLPGTDAMIPVLQDALSAQAGPGWLIFYGDHQPSLPQAFRGLMLTSTETNFAIWRPNAKAGVHQSLQAHELWSAISRCTQTDSETPRCLGSA